MNLEAKNIFSSIVDLVKVAATWEKKDTSALRERIANIEARNSRVEKDKKWETSWTRRLSIMTLTYAIVTVTLWVTGADRPYLGALIPSIGFLLSTLSIARIRKIWERS